MRQYQAEPRTYELLTILSPDVADDDLKGQLDAIAGYVATAGGEVTDVSRESPWGRRRLAYSIRHAGRDVRDGYYTLFHLRLEPRRVVEIERDIKLNDSIIRHLITLYEPTPSDGSEVPAAGGDQPAPTAEPAVQPAATAAPVVALPVEPAAAAVSTDSPEADASVEPAADAGAVAEPEVEAEPVAVPEAPAEPALDVEAPPETVAVAEPEPAPVAADAEVAAEVESEPAVEPEPAVQELSEETVESAAEPQVASTDDAENDTAASPATAPDEAPEDPPAPSDATPKEE